MYEIEKEIKKGDYLYALCKAHPNATNNGYVLLHRVVMENHLGRLLTSSEAVHHKDKDKFNNSIDNLEVMDRQEHCRLHASTGRAITYLVCPECDREFIRPSNQVKTKLSFCSRSCNGKYYSKLQVASSSLTEDANLSEFEE